METGFQGWNVLDSVRKGSFCPISASICAFACAAACRSLPRKGWITLILGKTPHFRPGNNFFFKALFPGGHLLGWFHPERVFLSNLGANLQVWLCGDLQVASAHAHDFLEIGENPHSGTGNRVLREIISK
ncbi:hypothetical protein TRIP_B170043 [uncultured Desulfatiglans sp.]|nr:hypothetical protein TRIP_B170043 [uncultured Desulfatiglans sp.]